MLNPVSIQRIFRKLRAPNFSRLVEGTDGYCYRVRFAGNLEAKRALVNEWIGSFFLRQLHLPTTVPQILQVSPDVLACDPDWQSLRKPNATEKPLVCLGSRYPVHFDEEVMWPFLPGTLQRRVINLNDFAAVFTLDALWGMHSCRHVLFVRDRPQHPKLFGAYFVDHTAILGGSRWQLQDAEYHSSFCHCRLHHLIPPTRWREAINQIQTWSIPDCSQALAGLPEDWLTSEDRQELNRLFHELRWRQQHLSERIQLPVECRHRPLRKNSGTELREPCLA